MIGARTTSIARGVCNCHKYPISASAPLVTFSPDCSYEGLGAGRISDIVRNGCGHIGSIINGASTTFINGIPAASRVTGCVVGSIVSGSSTVNIGA